jgi:hypothetical protein
MLITSHNNTEANLELFTVLSSIIDNKFDRVHLTYHTLDALAQVGRFGSALSLMGPYPVDDFISTVVSWFSPNDCQTDNFVIQVTKNIIRIVGSVRPDWNEINRILINTA